MGMAVLEGSLSPGHRRRMSKLAASPPPTTAAADTDGEDSAAADTSAAADAEGAPTSPSHSPTHVPPIDLSNFVVTMSMASHSLQVIRICRLTRVRRRSSILTPPCPSQSPPRFDSRIDGVVPSSPRGMPVWDFNAQLQHDALVRERNRLTNASVAPRILRADVFLHRRTTKTERAATRTQPWTCSSTTTAAETCRAGACTVSTVAAAADLRLRRDEDELARERDRKMRLLDKQMGAVLRTVPTVPPKPRRGDFNSAM